MEIVPIDPLRQLIARWPKGEVSHVELLRKAGIEVVLDDAPAAAFAEAATTAGITVVKPGAIGVVVTEGLWPGIARAPSVKDRGDETTSASKEPWVDANGYLVQFHSAMTPGRPAVLGYQADGSSGLKPDRVVPFETLELALVEARLNGGNYILSVDPRYREALLKGETKALAAWEALGRAARWLKQVSGLLGFTTFSTMTMLVDAGESAELANLMFRRGGSPRLVHAKSVPPPNPDRIVALVAAGLKEVPPSAYAHARAGSTVVTDAKPDPAWDIAKKDTDRTFYRLGKGQVVAYHDAIGDPSEFSLDVIDIVNYKRRAARLWNALAAIPLATDGPKPGEALLHVVNYGSKVEAEVQCRIQGHFAKATLLRPEANPEDLKVFRRGSTTEVFLPSLDRAAIVHFAL